MPDEVLTATDASRGFSELLNRVAYGGESFVVKKGQKLMARIVPVEEGAEKKPARKKAAAAPPAAPEEPPAAPPRREEPKIVTPAPRAESKPSEEIPAAAAGNAGSMASPPVDAASLSIPEGFTEEDVDFYADLIARIRPT